MRSRFLLGVGAWLLGVVAATAGSLYAVDQLGEGLLGQHSKEISVAAVNAELALENSGTARPAASPSQPPAARPWPRARPSAGGSGSGQQARQVQRQASRLLTSAGGTAAASCDNGFAHLLYWSPGQGFEVRDVHPGPSRSASVTFTNSSGGVVMRVFCGAGSVPHSHVSTWTWGRSRHDE